MTHPQPLLCEGEMPPDEPPTIAVAPAPEPTDPHGLPPEEPPSRGATAGLFVFGIGAVVAATIAVAVLAIGHRQALADEVVTRTADLAKGPRVRTTQVQLAPGARSVTLPGEVHAWVVSNLYAKISGYLKEISVDKGDTVRAGELIGRLESPETDQTVFSAIADLELKKITAERDHALVKKGYVAQQDVDTADSQLKESQANLSSAKTMQQYEAIRAPFDGVVTTRYVDPGALLPAATSSTQAAQPIVEISDLSRLRVYVYLGQDDAALVQIGDAATITMDQRPDITLKGAVGRISRALDPQTRTMLVEIDLDNRKTRIYPGEFVHVSLRLSSRPYPVVPAGALISRKNQFFVAIVENGRARFVPVTTGQDDGQTVQIVTGLHGGETVAVDASTDIEDGSPVQPIPTGR